ncbi:MAG: GTPase Era [Rhodospirillaceae bacterium]
MTDGTTGATTGDTVPQTKCGFIAVLGAPNAGKSTLVNEMVGTKVSIVSPKVQTTRTRLRGIAMVGNTQLVLIDTPGIFRPTRRLERAMVAAAWGGAADAEQIMLVVDASHGIDADTAGIIATLKEGARKDVILVLNKIDLVARPDLLVLSEKLFQEGLFGKVFMISAMKGDGVGDILRYLADNVPPGPFMFPEDEVSDLPQRMLAAEITREKVFLRLNQELPYSVTVETEKWEERPDGSARIDLTIYVLRESQKKIVLGKGGAQIKAIGASARRELEQLLERRIHLFLFVKVREGWTDDRARYAEWGLDFDA